MYENMTVLTNTEYAELIIKAHKYDKLREMAVNGSYVTDREELIFELTEDELKAIDKNRRDFNEAI